MSIVATLRSKQKVFSNKKQIGTSLGASLLFNIKKKSKLNLNKISILENTHYKKLYKIWIDEIKNKNLLNYDWVRNSAQRNPSIIAGADVFPELLLGNAERSQTLRFSIPLTLNFESSTAILSLSAPILAVPEGW